MWLLALAFASADKCTITTQVDGTGQLVFLDRGDCPPWFQIQLENSVGQDAPLPLPEFTLIELPVVIEGRAAFLGPAVDGRLVGPTHRDGPDLTHLAERVPQLPVDCELLVSVDADGHIDGVAPVDCPVEDYGLARRKARRARFAASETGGHVRLPLIEEALVSAETEARP